MSSRLQHDHVQLRTVQTLQRDVAALRSGRIPRLTLPLRLQTPDRDCVLDLDDAGVVVGCGITAKASARAEQVESARSAAIIPPFEFVGGALTVVASAAWPAPHDLAVAGAYIRYAGGTGSSTIRITTPTATNDMAIPSGTGVKKFTFTEVEVPAGSTITISCTVATGAHTGVVVSPIGVLTAG